MKSIFSIRSPLWQIVSSVFLYALLALIAYTNQNPTFPPILTVCIFGIGLLAVAYIFVFASLAKRYNKTHTHSRIDAWGPGPAELRDDDEGMRMFTGKATQQVYRYHAFALPFAAILITYLHDSIYLTLAVLMLLTIGHYVTYWRAIWPALQDD